MDSQGGEKMTTGEGRERNVLLDVALRAVASSELGSEQLSTLRSKNTNARAVGRVDSCSPSERVSTDLALAARPGNLTTHCCARRFKHGATLNVARRGVAEFEL